MCGRYALTASSEQLMLLFDLLQVTFDLVPRYNLAPTQLAPVVHLGEDGLRTLTPMNWGLVPRWAKDRSIGSRLINARGETVAEKPAFRTAFRERRCLVPADGFYEWRSTDAGKQPYFIHRADHSLLVMAGLWETWRDPNGRESLQTFTILTTHANRFLAPLHDRMPVFIDRDRFDAWLSRGAIDGTSREDVLRPVADDVLVMHPVSTRVNSPAHDEPNLVEPIAVGDHFRPSAEQPRLFD